MKLLFIGDIVARPGRDLVRRGLPGLVRRHGIDVVVANGENAAAGAGITREITTDLLKAGIHVLTSGNHIWDKREVLDFIADEPRLIRPANYPAGTPGSGSTVWRTGEGVAVGVINIMGRIFMAPLDNPFDIVKHHIARVRDAGATLIVVDFHAEATSEKLAMGWYLDGDVTAVIGTHTHVQTADERVLPGGTAYLTDVGMTGPHDGVIGMDRAGAIARFITALPLRYEAATGDARLHAVIVTADPATGRACAIERLAMTAAELEL
ncbi:MAG TPA: TIGR00282 family metallophosphoesterase [Vicinamibacterales bacterium]|nr:TIGR00282 family metallophosphoesterase [Vicinamibacterales bacterium]